MPDTYELLLDAAEEIVQQRGFNGFSFADLSSAVKITKASVHYHFPTKAELGRRLILRYRERFLAALKDIAQSTTSTREALLKYADLYEQVLRARRMCLCGILVAEFETLPPEIRHELLLFIQQNEAWLCSVLERDTAIFRSRPNSTPASIAKFITAALEGALLLARATQDISRFQSTAANVIDGIAPP